MKNGNAVLQVIDDGVGMDQETLDHIYERHKVDYHSNGVGTVSYTHLINRDIGCAGGYLEYIYSRSHFAKTKS